MFYLHFLPDDILSTSSVFFSNSNIMFWWSYAVCTSIYVLIFRTFCLAAYSSTSFYIEPIFFVFIIACFDESLYIIRIKSDWVHLEVFDVMWIEIAKEKQQKARSFVLAKKTTKNEEGDPMESAMGKNS